MLSKIQEERINSVFNEIEKKPEKIQKVYENIKIYKDLKKLSPQYILKWENLLKEKSLLDIKFLMLENNEEGELLRSTNMFARILER